MSDREFDIVIFGATGMAGRYCIEQLHKSSSDTIKWEAGRYCIELPRDNIKWAVAGRNRTRLSEVLKEVSGWVNTDLSNKAVIEADVHKPESLSEMAKRTRCIINTVGPYTLWGEQVIKACLEQGTHLLDLSGELHFNEGMRNKYHREAKQKGVMILQTTGFDSIPGEMILQYAKQNFPGKLNTLETYVTFREGEHGAAVNTGTFNSVIQICQNIRKIPAIREEAWRSVFEQPWQKVEHRRPLTLMITKQAGVPGYTVPFIGGDKPVMNHSEFFRREIDPEYQRVQFQAHLYNESLLQILGLAFIFMIVGLFSQVSPGRFLLERYPSFFTFGMFRKGGPTRQQVLTCGFTTIGVATGWLQDEPRESKPMQRIVVRVDGPEVGYMTTSICMVQTAICLLREGEKSPMKGGYLTPGFVLEKSSLLQRLEKNGFKFSVVEKTFGQE